MAQFFKKPNPYNEDLRQNVKLVFYTALGVSVFLALFQPINLTEYSASDIIYLLGGVAVVTFLLLTFNIILLPSLFPKLFFQKKKNFTRDLFWNIYILLSLSLGNLVLFVQLFGLKSINNDVVSKISLLGVLPLSVLIITNHFRSLRAQLRNEREINKKLSQISETGTSFVHFESEYKSDNFIVKPEAIVLIRAADNYIEVYYQTESEIKSRMIRSSLLKAETLLKDFDFIIRTQRSFIVNVNHIQEIQNVSDGYKLLFKLPELVAFVSQKYITDFKKLV